MADLQRITTEYIEIQDRLRLAGELADGAPQVLWLTQRLLQRLLPVLFQQLQQGQGADAVHAELLHSFAQQAARAELVPQAPVQVSCDSTAWLVLAVDIAQSDQGLRLTFKGPPEQQGQQGQQEQQASLTLAAQPLRQWLGILHGAYCQAQWPLQVWPQWLQESCAPVAAPVLVLH